MSLVVLLISVFILGCGGSSNSESEESGYLFLQSASSGILKPIGESTMVLLLEKVQPSTNYFSNRSSETEPQAGTIPTSTFIESWNDPNDSNNFSNLPPNAALDVYDSSGEMHSMALVLSVPVYDASAQTLRYRAKIIENFSTVFEGREVSTDFPTEFQNPVLFIDNGNIDTSENHPFVLGSPRSQCVDNLDKIIGHGQQQDMDSLGEEICNTKTLCGDYLSDIDQCKYIASFILTYDRFRSDPCAPTDIPRCEGYRLQNDMDTCMITCRESGCDMRMADGCVCLHQCFKAHVPVP
jgi:hypothetical protein